MKNIIKKLPLKKALAFAGASIFSLSANAFSDLYIFGDSLSDTGNLNLVTQGQIPARFTNGDTVAVDVLAAELGTAAIPAGQLAGLNIGNNYAVGGAIALDEDGDETTPDTNLPTQINAYLAANSFVSDPSALYVVVIGGNDLFAAQAIRGQSVTAETREERKAARQASRARVDEAVEGVIAQVTKLIGTGAQNILIGNAPDISKVPNTDLFVAGLLAQADTNAEIRRANRMFNASAKLTHRFNRKLSRAIEKLEHQTGLDIIEWDLEGFLDGQIEDAEELGYTNTDDACAPVPQGLACDGFVFADGVHPTSVVHTRAGQDLIELLND